MGGEIGVRSDVGEGSTFWFTARFEKQQAAHPESKEPAPIELTGRRVLVVDDNETNRTILHYQLQAWSVDDHAAADAEAALIALRAAACSGRPFELVLLDRQMPGTDGIMLAQAIQRDPAISGLPLVMMTSLGEHEDDREMSAAGVLMCLTKPLKHAQVRRCLERALARSTEATIVPPGGVSPAARQANRGRVLVAEDNPVNQKVALLQLRRLGYSADAVGNGAGAVEALSRISYDIVLMDCQMPEVDGYAATRLIRNQRYGRHVPIIAMTASALTGERERCLEAGMDDYISKPISGPDLEAALLRWSSNEKVAVRTGR
jgi:CheY-like chemotaxis protein